VKDEWLQREEKVWKDHLFSFDLDLSDKALVNSTFETDGGIEIKVVFRAEDPWGNSSEQEFTFKVNV
jgi:hypothetical protein